MGLNGSVDLYIDLSGLMCDSYLWGVSGSVDPYIIDLSGLIWDTCRGFNGSVDLYIDLGWSNV